MRYSGAFSRYPLQSFAFSQANFFLKDFRYYRGYFQTGE